VKTHFLTEQYVNVYNIGFYSSSCPSLSRNMLTHMSPLAVTKEAAVAVTKNKKMKFEKRGRRRRKDTKLRIEEHATH
jgi:hypothetical protein